MRPYFEFVSATRVLLATLAGTVILFIVFPALPVGAELLDVKSGYSYDDVVAAMTAYGEAGRLLYAWASPTMDTLLPLVYVSFLAGLIYRFRPTEGLWVLALLPVVGGFVDLGENAQITVMLIQYPDISVGQVASASLFTQAKAILLSGCFLLAAVLALTSFARWGYGRIRRGNESTGDPSE